MMIEGRGGIMGKEALKREAAISVIIPVYKVEPYLRCCIDSVLAQTFEKFELILVDDGSPDNCGTICDEYAAKEERIVTIHQKNTGVAAARNTGLDWVFANSDSLWVTFVDSDDVIVPNYLECLHQYAMENNADIVTTNCRYIQHDAQTSSIHQVPTSIQSIMNGREVCLGHYGENRKMMPTSWGKLFRKDLIGSHRFPVDVTFFEDEEFVLKVAYDANRVLILNAWLYGYRNRPGSVLQEPFSLRRYDYFKNLDACIQYFQENNENEIVSRAKKTRSNAVARYTLLAYGAKILKQVPRQYRIPVWKAFLMEIGRTIREGGLKVFFRRIRNFMKELGLRKK